MGVFSIKCMHSANPDDSRVVAACGSEVLAIHFDRNSGNWVVEPVELAAGCIPKGGEVIGVECVCCLRPDAVEQAILVLSLAVPPAKQPPRADQGTAVPGRVPTSYQSRGVSAITSKAPSEEESSVLSTEDEARAEATAVQFFLHVYGGQAADVTDAPPIPLAHVARDWTRHVQVIELASVPFMVASTPLAARAGDSATPFSVDTALVVLGSDRATHVYRREFGDFIECGAWRRSVYNGPRPAVDSDLEVLSDMLVAGVAHPALPSPPVVVDIKRLGSRRLVAVGCRCGHVRLASVPLPLPYTDAPQPLDRSGVVVLTAQMDGPISAIKLFSRHPASSGAVESLSRDYTNACRLAVDAPAYPDAGDLPDCHLLVCSAGGPAVVYRDVLIDGMGSTQVLPGSMSHDALLCCAAADIDFDGATELLVGCYGQELLVYEYRDGEYAIGWQRHFSKPVVALDVMDVFGDGVRCIVVGTQRGVHFLQPDLAFVSSILSERLQKMTE